MRSLLLILILLLTGCSADIRSDKLSVPDIDIAPYHFSLFQDAEEMDRSMARNQVVPESKKIYGAVAPHHTLAIDTMAELFASLAGQSPPVVVIVGPNHFNAGNKDVIISEQGFMTPYGVLEPALDISAGFKGFDHAIVNEAPFANEHSISALTGFVKKTWPEAKFLPVILKMDAAPELAEHLGYRLAKLLPPESLVIASCDFAHHVSKAEAEAFDKESIRYLSEFDVEGINRAEVDSKGSLTALMSYLKQAGAEEFNLVKNTNAAEIIGQPDYDDVTSYIAGYFTEGEPVLRAENKPLKLLFVGDLMLDRHVLEKIKNDGVAYLMDELAGELDLFSFDLVSANLEGAVTPNGEHYPPVKSYDFSFKPELVEEFKDYNFGFFNLANNHITDQGEKGVQLTRENLDRLGFAYSGSAEGRIDEYSARVVEVQGKNIGMLGLSLIYSYPPEENIAAKVEELKKGSDLVIVNIHWGDEYQRKHKRRQEELAHFLIDAGADAVIGHHPHVVQDVEIYKDKPIFYSLGNFIFDQYFSKETQEGLMVGIEFQERKTTVRLFPTVSRLSRLRLMNEQEKEAFLKEINELSDLEDKYRAQLKRGELVI